MQGSAWYWPGARSDKYFTARGWRAQCWLNTPGLHDAARTGAS
jgi:hypothetical protein